MQYEDDNFSSEVHLHTSGGVNVPGLVSVVIFYAVIFAAGLYASWKSKQDNQGREQTSEDLMLAGRKLGMFIGFFTMTGMSRFIAPVCSYVFMNRTVSFLSNMGGRGVHQRYSRVGV